jgi:hypothetical protein
MLIDRKSTSLESILIGAVVRVLDNERPAQILGYLGIALLLAGFHFDLLASRLLPPRQLTPARTPTSGTSYGSATTTPKPSSFRNDQAAYRWAILGSKQ